MSSPRCFRTYPFLLFEVVEQVFYVEVVGKFQLFLLQRLDNLVGLLNIFPTVIPETFFAESASWNWFGWLASTVDLI